jgi:hypothetical protein
MAVPSQITDHAAQARARLGLWFKNSTALHSLTDAFSEQVQDLEDSGVDMLALFDIDAQTGDGLDTIGAVVNEPRAGATDANYRVAIRSKIALIYSSGTPDEIIAVFERLTGSTSIDFIEEYPAAFDIYGDGSQPAGLVESVDAAAAGGVRTGLLDFLEWDDGDDAIWDDSDTIYVRYASSVG